MNPIYPVCFTNYYYPQCESISFGANHTGQLYGEKQKLSRFIVDVSDMYAYLIDTDPGGMKKNTLYLCKIKEKKKIELIYKTLIGEKIIQA